MKTFLIISACALAVIIAVVWHDYIALERQAMRPLDIAIVSEVATSSASISLIFVGDVMLDRGVRQSADIHLSSSTASLFEYVKDTIEHSDIAMFNLEGPVSDKGENVGSIYSFRMATDTLQVLKNVGFDIASFANNHVGDWSRDGFVDTLVRAQDAGMLVSGAGFSYASTTEPTVVEKNGIRIGLLSFSDVGPAHMQAGSSTPGILLLSDPNLESIIKNAKTKADHLVVSVHWGEEYRATSTERQQEYAHKLIDWGATLVGGHHPHVIEPGEEYNGGLIDYSLGNFIFDQAFSKETMQGSALDVVLDIEKIVSYVLRRTEQDLYFRPHFVAESGGD